MAKFTGTAEEFNRYFGPRIRNLVNQFTRTYKLQVGKCEECGATHHLEAAHVHGYERPILIKMVLEKHGFHDFFDVDLEQFEGELRTAHNPLSTTIRVLCHGCHHKYDSMVEQAKAITADAPQSTFDSQINAKRYDGFQVSSKALQFSFDPPSHSEFKSELIKTGAADLIIYYMDGRVARKIWHINKFDETSSLLGNLHSRSEFRRKAAAKSGIDHVHVQIHRANQ